MTTTTTTADQGDWCRVRYTLLEAPERASNLPVETAQTPYVVYATGWLQEPAEIGRGATVQTLTGRLVEGTLVEIQPGDWHTFGAMHPELRRVTRYINDLQRSLDDHQ